MLIYADPPRCCSVSEGQSDLVDILLRGHKKLPQMLPGIGAFFGPVWQQGRVELWTCSLPPHLHGLITRCYVVKFALTSAGHLLPRSWVFTDSQEENSSCFRHPLS